MTHRILLVLFIVVTVLAETGCGDESSAVTLSEKLRSEGVDLELLFQPVTSAELVVILAEWMNRDLVPDSARIVREQQLEGGDDIAIIEYTYGDERGYGAFVVPAGASDDLSGLDVVVSSIGFGRELRLELSTSGTARSERIATLVPSFRGHELVFDGETWESTGDAFDQCDGGTDDVLRFVEAVALLYPDLDLSQIVYLGGSRGGNVSMLAGIRDARARAVISLAGPSDYFRRDLLDHPNLQVLYANWFVKGLLEGETDLIPARRRMLSCSPAYFARYLPSLQNHHGTADRAVPVEQSISLQATVESLDEVVVGSEFYLYEGGDHSLASFVEEIEARMGTFINQSLETAPIPTSR